MEYRAYNYIQKKIRQNHGMLENAIQYLRV